MITQTEIAEKVNASRAHVSMIFSGKRRPGYKLAKRFSALTGTKITLWLEGSPIDMRRAAGLLDSANSNGKASA